METETLQKLKSRFDTLSQNIPDEGIEFWFARDLQEPLGYVRWENFQTAIQRAITSCQTTGYEPNGPLTMKRNSSSNSASCLNRKKIYEPQ